MKNPIKHTASYLTEGLGSFIKNIATGDIEGDIESLEKEMRDVHTPEQQRFVLTKIVRLLEQLIIIRHNKAPLKQFVHDRVAWFQRVVGKDSDAGKEMDVRVGENIARLARLRDKLLTKKWEDDKYNDKVDEMKRKAEDILQQAASTDEKSFD